jgi:hypothetical protein
MVHLLFFLLEGVGRGFSTALVKISSLSEIPFKVLMAYLIASSKTDLRFLWVSAEHSRYLTALISRATARACSYETGSIFLERRPSAVERSSRRSSLVPTNMIGTPGA